MESAEQHEIPESPQSKNGAKLTTSSRELGEDEQAQAEAMEACTSVQQQTDTIPVSVIERVGLNE